MLRETKKLDQFAGGKQSKELRKQKILPRYCYTTPKGGGKPSVSLDEKKSHRNAPAMNQSSCTEKMNLFLAENLSKNIMGSSMDDSNNNGKARKSKSRGVSPSVRPIIPGDQIPGLSEEKTQDRSVSASRGRTNTSLNTCDPKKKQGPVIKTTRQSCSPSVTRGRRQENEKFQQGNNSSSSSRTQVLGSRMVDRFIFSDFNL